MSATQVPGQQGVDIDDRGHGHPNLGHAAINQVKHAAGADEDKSFAPVAAVDQQQTQQPYPQTQNGIGSGPQVKSAGETIDVVCGPLLNYRHMSGEHTDSPVWHGSVLLVTQPGQVPRELSVSAGSAASGGSNGMNSPRSFAGTKLYEDSVKAFFQYSIDVPFLDEETTWSYSIPNLQMKQAKPLRFNVPSKHVSMRIMFHSCNGFSVGTDEEEWSGPALWNEVLRIHEKRPIHVMVGGGDQIYNDSVRVTGPLKEWTSIGNPIKRRDFPFNEELRVKCDEFYFNNYTRWYNCAPFSTANGQIPQVNIWDDHDIIDGFGSYTDHFMKCAVFRGIGGVAHKYYLLFQHHIPPPVSTFTTDAPHTTKDIEKTAPVDTVQLKNTFVLTKFKDDPSYLIGKTPGPYVNERSRNLYCQLGKSIALLGIDARTERTRHQVNYPETYDMIFRHAEEKLTASAGAIKHLILLLGIPIAYPRLQWLENILSSPIIGPVKFLNKRFGLAGGFFNQFDGKPDLLDDLDDHYTSRTHKKERKHLVLRLQELSKKLNVRVTILGGDVHLAAMGRFFSKASLNIPIEQDHRFMPNIISSAITNHPPPQAVANLLAKRNKVHHLDHDTDETLLELFDKDPGHEREGLDAKSADSNHATMPSRNFAIISESHAPENSQNGYANGHLNGNGTTVNDAAFTTPKNPREPIHRGELNAGTAHPAASGTSYTGLAGPDGLDVAYRVEIDHTDREGRTIGYGLSIPALEAATVGDHKHRH